MEKITEQQLVLWVNQTGEGSEQALAHLYSHLARRIHGFAFQYLSDTHQAEEVVTETMFEVWKNAKIFAGGSKVTTWVLGIARHKALDKLRGRDRIGRVEQEWDDAAEEIVSEETGALRLLEQEEMAETVAECIAQLPEDQRKCIHMVFFQELSISEVAEIECIPKNTVKTRLFHARRKLRSALERRLGNDGYDLGTQTVSRSAEVDLNSQISI